MSGNIKELIEIEKRRIYEDKTKLKLISNDEQSGICDKQQQQQHENNNVQSLQEFDENDKENVQLLNLPKDSLILNKNLPLVDRLDLDNNKNNEGALEECKQAFINKLIHSENPLTVKSDDISNKMFRYGEYSPNNPEFRVTTAPYLGLGEYEQRRNYCLEKQRADYLEHLSKVQYELDSFKNRKIEPTTDHSIDTLVDNLSSYNRLDQRLTSAQNALLLKTEMDKPKSILSNRRTGSPRERLRSDLKHSYTPSFLDGFSSQDHSKELEHERLKREVYQQELRLQIEEKRRLQAMREEQERREQELENRRLEQQLLRMQEEQMIEQQQRHRRDEMRRHSEDLLRRKHELQTRHLYRKHTDSESSVSNLLRNTNVASTTSTTTSAKALSHYSPPVTRRNPYSYNLPSTSVFSEPTSKYNMNRYDTYYRKDALNRMDSLYKYNATTFPRYNKYNAFNRYDSLNRIDMLDYQDTLDKFETLNIKDNLSNIQRRHSATQQDLSVIRKSPRLQRRSNSSRFDDTLPIPVLNAHSPVAKELKNSVPFNSSRHSSDAVRKLEDKWQVPAVQKTIINHGDPLRDGQNRSILTQLGAIRMQLQQEQLKMDENLRKRDFTQSKAVDFH